MTAPPGAKERSKLSPGLLAAALIAAFGALYAVFARVALHSFPFSGDEYSTLLQAEIFARGLLHAPAPAHAELFRVDHVILDHAVRSKYPPGAAVLLALGVRLGLPWLVTPIEGVVALFFTWKAARTVMDDRAALVALAFLGAAPLFVFNSASFYSHTTTTMWLAMGTACLAAWTRDARSYRLLLLGACVGCAFLTRPLDAVLFGAALLAFRSIRLVVLVGLGALPFLGLHFLYQSLQFGSPLADGYHLYAATMTEIYGARETPAQVGLRFLVDPIEIFNHIDVTRAFLLDWTVPGTALIAALGFVSLRDDAKSAASPKGSAANDKAAPLSRFAFTGCAVFFVFFLFTMAAADDGARPRYLSTPLLLASLLAGPGWAVAMDSLRGRLGPRITRAAAAIVWALPVAQLATFVEQRMPKLSVRESLPLAVASNGVTSGVVVVRAQYPTRYARNGPFFDAPVLYLSPRPETSLDEIAAAFPGQAVYEAFEPARESWDHPPWRLVRAR
jgi:hypothetical protein